MYAAGVRCAFTPKVRHVWVVPTTIRGAEARLWIDEIRGRMGEVAVYWNASKIRTDPKMKATVNETYRA